MSRLLPSFLLFALLLLASCGDEPAPTATVPAWAKVAPEQIAEAEKHGVPVAFENDLGMRFVLIPAGTFLMGSPSGDAFGHEDDETQHEVTISRPYYMQITEVTNEQYGRNEAACEDVPDGDTAPEDARKPATGMTRAEAASYAMWVSTMAGARNYRLPSEAEWEYACRAGTTTRFWWGDDVRDGAPHAHLRAARSVRPGRSAAEAVARLQACPVASLHPSPWGLYDLHGNVAEWVADDFVPYTGESVRDPHVAKDGGRPIARGGHANMPRFIAGAAHRDVVPSARFKGPWDGFRLVADLPAPGEGAR